MKAKRPSVPIIMLTARGQEVDKVVGLELGADDYVTKPLSVRELIARVKAALRRVSLQARVPESYRFSDVEVDIRGHEVKRAGKPVELSAKEFALLTYFISHPRGNCFCGLKYASVPGRRSAYRRELGTARR